MPLSEFLRRLAKEKFDSSQEKNSNCANDLPQGGENDFVELVWENGQIQSSKARKFQNSNSVQNSKIRDKDLGNGRFGVGPMNSGIDEVPISVSSGLHQDDEMVPWLNYPVDDLLQQDYCSEFLSELSGVTINEHSQSTFTSLDKRNGLNSDQGQMPKASSVGDSDVTRVRTSSSQLYPPSSQQCQFPHLRSRVLSSNHEAIRTPTDHDSMRVSCSGANFPNPKQPPLQPNSSSGLMNFSHFLRPAKANFQNIGSRAGSGLADIERIGSKDKNSTNEPMPFDCKPAEEPVGQRKLETLDQRDESKSDKQCVQVAESAIKGLVEGEKNSEPIVTSSSVCSGSDEPMHNLKRKNREADSSEGPSEENEEEPAGAKKGAQARGCKRTRAAEVHNLSERRRRDRINEKMRALQELIPNCNKVDKASMLDEAIEYLKTLQLQVQIMSMGSGLYMPQMMMGPGLPHIATHMAQFGGPMGIGMGMGLGFGMGMPDMMGGSPGCSMVQMPHFPGPPMAGPGMGGSGYPVFGMPSQGHPMQYPCPPMMPVAGGLAMRPMGINGGVVGGLGDNSGSGSGSCSKDLVQNVNSQPMHNDSGNSSMNQTATQCQVPEECGEKPGLVQNGVRTSEVTDNGALKPANGNDNIPS